jgi:DNA-binding MarR family transcriptional regulator
LVPVMLRCARTAGLLPWGKIVVATSAALYSKLVATTIPDEDVTVDTPWLDRPQLRAWIRLRAVLALLPGVLDAQLRRDAGLTEFEYHVLATLSETPGRTLRMTELSRRSNATLPRLSHVVTRLQGRGLVERRSCPENRRTTNVLLTDDGWEKVRQAAPGHVATVHHHVIDALTAEQLDQLTAIGDALLTRLDPSGTMAATYTRYDGAPEPQAPADG